MKPLEIRGLSKEANNLLSTIIDLGYEDEIDMYYVFMYMKSPKRFLFWVSDLISVGYIVKRTDKLNHITYHLRNPFLVEVTVQEYIDNLYKIIGNN